MLNVAKFRFGWSRCSPLNAALVANEEKRTQNRMFRANVHVFLTRFSNSVLSRLGLQKSRFGFFGC